MNIISIMAVVLIIIVSIESIRLSLLGFRSKQLAKRTTPASQTADKEMATILVVGDSLAYGTGSLRPENSLVGRLAKDYDHLTIVNHAENGANIKTVINQLENVGDKKFTIVIIYIGGIDTLTLTRISKIKNRLQRLYQLANEVSIDSVIHVSVNNTGLVPMLRFPLNLLYTSRSRKISNLSQTLSTKYAIVNIPLYREKKQDPLQGKQTYYAKDKIHPNDQGYKIWYKEMAKIFRSCLEKYNLKSK